MPSRSDRGRGGHEAPRAGVAQRRRAYDENLDKVNAAIDAGQKKAFTDDQVRDSFQQPLAATGDVNEALNRQQLAMDLSRGAGISLEAASRMVGKVTDENVQAFKRMGITIADGATEAEALAACRESSLDRATPTRRARRVSSSRRRFA